MEDAALVKMVSISKIHKINNTFRGFKKAIFQLFVKFV